MENTDRTKPVGRGALPCSIQGCEGCYERRFVLHTVRYKGQVIVFENVPADVCDTCGDILFDGPTVRRIEQLLEATGSHAPDRQVPLYEFAA
ncbi:MAG TPA: type II toxin-antitoxin system MqsA family antitoxin [Rhodothermales bacterium]|nr:type II toxin-antitoxin system MqsA family antitoxin [Rhodothermales bacterium]